MLFLRGEALAMVQDGRMPLPFRQRDFADALGLSLVHTNKILRKLRDRGVASWREGVLTVNDIEALKDEAWVDEVPIRPRPLI